MLRAFGIRLEVVFSKGSNKGEMQLSLIQTGFLVPRKITCNSIEAIEKKRGIMRLSNRGGAHLYAKRKSSLDSEYRARNVEKKSTTPIKTLDRVAGCSTRIAELQKGKKGKEGRARILSPIVHEGCSVQPFGEVT